MTPETIARMRADTPSCADLLHFNNAGASLMPDPVWDAMSGHLDLERRIGGYEAAAHNAQLLDGFYTSFARLLGADPSEIAYVESATRGWDMAFYGAGLQAGDEVITHASEYASNYLAFLHVEQKLGIRILRAPSDATGQVDVAALEAMITPRTRMIAITHVPSQGGLVNPAAAVGAVARRHDILYLLDACQSVGQIDVNVGHIGCDMLSGTGRKFLRGPRGTGFLYVSRRVMDRITPPFIDLHSATWTGPDTYAWQPNAKRYEAWESFVAGRIGLAAAVDYALTIGMPAIEARVTALAARLRAALCDLPGVHCHDLGRRRSGIVTLSVDGHDPQAIKARLSAQGINTSVTPATYAQLDLGARGLHSLLRASVHYYNTDDEVDRFVGAIGVLAKG